MTREEVDDAVLRPISVRASRPALPAFPERLKIRDKDALIKAFPSGWRVVEPIGIREMDADLRRHDHYS